MSAEYPPQSRFTVERLPEAQRYEAWRESIGSIFNVSMTRTQRQTEGFFATLDAHLIDSLLVARTRSVEQNWQRPAWKIARDSMDHYMLQLYCDGSQICDWSGGSVDMPSGGLLVYDLSQEMRAISSTFDNLSLVVPRTMLAPLLIRPDDQHMRVLGPNEPLVRLLYDHISYLASGGSGVAAPQSAQLAQSSVHLIAACLNSASDSDCSAGSEVVPSQLMAARRIVEEGLWDANLGPGTLCRSLQVSRSRLYEIFSGLGGVAAYIRERRLASAVSMLIAPGNADVPIGRIAERCLFSPSEFSRAFRLRYGVSPRAVRHYGLQRQSGFAEADGALDTTYERWLRELGNSAGVPGQNAN